MVVNNPNLDKCSWKPLVLVHDRSLEVLILLAGEESGPAAARGWISVETIKEAKQAEARYLYICNAAGSAHKTALPISINEIRARQIRTFHVCPPTGDSNLCHFPIKTNQTNNYSRSKWQLALIFLSVMFLEVGFPEYLDCLQAGPGMSKPTTHMVVEVLVG